MLDTNMVSFIIKRRSLAAGARLLALPINEIACISTITEAELMFGLFKSGDKEPARKLLELSLVRLTIYPWDSRAAASYGFLRCDKRLRAIRFKRSTPRLPPILSRLGQP